MPRSTKTNTEYMSNGLSISPAIPSAGDNVKITYDGLLSKNGANHIYVHVGFGSSWKESTYKEMARSTTGFEASIPVASADTLNVCFKDCANNWDNNSGKNYSFDISQ